MYAACLFCNRDLGTNSRIPGFPVGECLAYDADRGRLWVVCPHCARWNLAPLEERWEAIDACERSYRATSLRYSTGEIGIARIGDRFELIRIGRPLQPELAAWRYGRVRRAEQRSLELLTRVVPRLGGELAGRLGLRLRPGRIVHLATLPGGEPAVVRARHLASAELLRPERGEHWRLLVHHEAGELELAGPEGLHAAGKLLAALNGSGATNAVVRAALQKLEDAADPDGYFARVARLAVRTGWGRDPDAVADALALLHASSDAERLALYLTSRSFWSRGAIGSEPRSTLPRIPLVDRLALEMAANEDAERLAMAGELAALRRAWAEAEQIAAIADDLFSALPQLRRSASEAAAGGLGSRLWPSKPAPA